MSPGEEDVSSILGRKALEKDICEILAGFEEKSRLISFKKGIYLFGASGSGKTRFITDILKKMNYDVIKYNAGDTRNKSLINNINDNNIPSNNMLNSLFIRKQKLAILMDEIEAMNNGDKGGITALVKLIRQKKTKRQKNQESQTQNPIICIGNHYTDKKIKELMKVCHVFELKTPTAKETRTLLLRGGCEAAALDECCQFCQGDLRKIFQVLHWRETQPNWFNHLRLFTQKKFNYDSKKTTGRLIETPATFDRHIASISETDRTIVALLWHENIVDRLGPASAALYYQILCNICFSDNIDRITFQNQIWQFNEMSSLVKTFYNNKLFHEGRPPGTVAPLQEVRFTKILTKYSTEYNNFTFIGQLCNRMNMDRKDVFSFFQELRLRHGANFYNNDDWFRRFPAFAQAEVGKLDVRRIYKFLDQNEKRTMVVDSDVGEDDAGADDDDDADDAVGLSD